MPQIGRNSTFEAGNVRFAVQHELWDGNIDDRPAGVDAGAQGPSLKSDPKVLEALALLERGDWQQAHTIVQQHETQDAAWLHAIVHVLEGDLHNARYCRRVKNPRRCRGLAGGILGSSHV